MTSRRRTSRRMRANRRSSRRLYANANASNAIDPRAAIMYFYLHFEDYNVEEDAREGKRLAKRLMSDGSGAAVHELEGKALSKLSKLFKVRIFNEGHDRVGDLICGFGVDSWADVNRILKILNQRHVGGDDDIDTGVPYFVARDFTLYPRGVVGGPAFTDVDAYNKGSLTEWVEEHKP